ncbi:hypothetical protein LUW77_15015 [Streptomyces radiopugnans]|nr:hypothetical protein LUW77_15015 [Streptomyces radiopugnans]
MTEALRDDGEVDAGGEHERCLPVAEIVQPHPAQPGFVDQGAEQLRHVVRPQRVAVLPGEHEPVVGVRLAPLLALGVLPHPVRQQCADGALVQVDDAVLTARGLGLAERHAQVSGLAVQARRGGELVLLPPGLLNDLLPHNDDAPGEVDVGPAQPDGLTAAHPGTGDDLEQCTEAVRADVVEERAQLG